VDSNPKFEGRTLLERLNAAGIACTYLLLTGLSYVVKDATKFLMGAHGLLSNGAVVSRAGLYILYRF
jgi:translation initiation factor eIF-2B subunit delta